MRNLLAIPQEIEVRVLNLCKKGCAESRGQLYCLWRVSCDSLACSMMSEICVAATDSKAEEHARRERLGGNSILVANGRDDCTFRRHTYPAFCAFFASLLPSSISSHLTTTTIRRKDSTSIIIIINISIASPAQLISTPDYTITV